MDIKVLGTGCANCKITQKLIEDVAAEKGVAVTVGKVEDIQAIMSYGVMSTPGVVVNGKVVHAGGVPSRDKIVGWLSGSGATAAPAAPRAGGCGCGGGCA